MVQVLNGRRALAALALVLSTGLAGPSWAVEARPSLAEPTLSPDGKEIAFASGGDIWTVPAQGGLAHLLITDPATESRPVYSPDGAWLAFQSTRGGSANIYLLKLATGEITRLTWSDANEQLDGWSRDGKWLYFSSAANDVGRQNDIFRVAAAGGTPLEVSRETYLNEFSSAPSPDGKSVALLAKGMAMSQWWRNGHAHIDENEIWLKPIGEAGGYRRLVPVGAKHQWPMWRPDGQALWFMSDEGGAENIWSLGLAPGATPKALTSFKNGRLLWPSVAYDGSAIVFERGFEIWKLDPRSGQAAAVPITLRGAPASAGERRLSETSFRGLALSPDGKKVAVIAHGEVFAAPAKDGGPAQRITETVGAERDLAWAPDSRRLAFVSERGLAANLVEYDFTTGKSRDLTEGAAVDEGPTYSPDGKMLAYVRGARELHVATLAPNGGVARDTVVFTGALDRGGGASAAWSPDSRWVAFALTDRKSFRNVHVVEATGGPEHAVSFLANGNADQIAWSSDGKYLVFDSAQRSEQARIVRIDLLPHVPKYREDAFRDLFKPADAPDRKSPPTAPAGPVADSEHAKETARAKADAPPAPDAAKPPADKKPKPAPVEIVFEGIRERATFIPLGLDTDQPVISPDGKTLVFRARLAGQQNLYSYNLDELAKEPPSPVQLTASRKPKADVAFTPDSKELYYLDGGVVTSTPLETPKPKPIAIAAEMTVEFDQEKLAVFDEAWGTLNRRFFDPRFNGADWTALRARWLPYVAGAHTADELRRDINLMIGELNASHSGINRPPEGFGAAPTGRVGDLGLRFEREPFEAGRGLVIREVVALGPAAVEGSIKPGEQLLAVDGHAIEAHTNLDSLLLDRAGKRVVLRVAAAGKPPRDAVVRPVAGRVAAGLVYRQWVNDRRAYVEKISGGRLGYVHIADMSEDSLNQLYIDLDAQNQEKAGVVIDVRNNNGGFVNGYVLDVFTRKNFLNMTPRDLFAIPSRQGLGQRALGSPTVLVTNESSLSDAEDFTEGYRALGLGKVVGVPTAGWIIYTGGQPLIDGSVVRVPSVRIQDSHGGDLEMHPRPVDVTVERPLGETAAGKDAQLEAAVAELLKTVGPGR